MYSSASLRAQLVRDLQVGSLTYSSESEILRAVRAAVLHYHVHHIRPLSREWHLYSLFALHGAINGSIFKLIAIHPRILRRTVHGLEA